MVANGDAVKQYDIPVIMSNIFSVLQREKSATLPSHLQLLPDQLRSAYPILLF